MSRIRSRIVETASVNQRLLGRRSVTRSAIGPREVGALEQLPGMPRPIRPKDLAPETVQELDGRLPGETVTVSRSSQSIDPAGTLVEWDTVEELPAAAGGLAATTVPTTTLTPTERDAYYVLELEFEWDSYAGGGTVTVYVGDDAVATVTGTSGDHFVRTVRLGYQRTWPAVSVQVSHTDAGAQTLVNGQATLEKVDRIGPTAEPLLPYGWGELTATATIPADTEVGDLLIAYVHSFLTSNSTPAGWTLASGVSGSDDQRSLVYYRVAEAGDANSEVSVTGSGGSGREDLTVSIYRMPGIDTSDPFSGTISNSAAETTSRSVSTTTDAASRLLLIGSGTERNEAGQPVVTIPSEFGVARNVLFGGEPFREVAGTDEVGSGATGSKSVTLTGGEHLAAVLIPLRLA